MLPEAALTPDPEIPREETPLSSVQDGMLPRDIQRKTAYYDYVAEKKMSQVDAKLFYQRQLEVQNTEGNGWPSQPSTHGSPTMKARQHTNSWEQSAMKRSGSMRSMQSGQGSSQKLVLNVAYRLNIYYQADLT
jgi:AMP deaminase